MRYRATLLVAALAIPVDAPLAKQQAGTLAPAALSMHVAADGTVSAVTCDPEVAAPLCPVLTRAVSRWTFAPGQRDGKPVGMDAWLRLALATEQKPEGFAIRATAARIVAKVDGATEGGISQASRSKTPPRYPKEQLRYRVVATVMLELTRQASSLHPAVTQAWVGGQSPRGNDPFVTASKAAAEAWALDDWQPGQLTSCVRIAFTVDNFPRRPPGAAPWDTAPCTATYADGFALPTLLTDPTTAVF